jgi:hypothetical protein
MRKRPFKTLCAVALALVAPFLVAERALSNDAPVVLTIHPAQGTPPIEPTDADLMALTQTSFVTSTLWTAERHSFSGPSLHRVLAQFGAEPSAPVKLVAANDYAVTLEPEMIGEQYLIIANRLDDAPFSIREKGPLWVMFPFDQKAEFKTELHYSLSVWQLTDIRLGQPGAGPDAGN